VLGTVLFNFGFVTTVPSWINEKRPHVSVNKTVWFASFMCNVIFFVIGIVGCMAFGPYLAGPASNNCYGFEDQSKCAQSIMDGERSRADRSCRRTQGQPAEAAARAVRAAAPQLHGLTPPPPPPRRPGSSES
jgi:hypothetical protein